ncbi:hypothetical protein E2K80_12885 [Rhodophyticola sp. CCM32]|uniref:hypothetical protein n=1 Tax=Rhodophyticola sp. CCM32 TaxID=2916397 RepID=UPI00107F2F57|nr:hypothetical protein [Rhodophyticola sp. CCM32]QBY01508.1 hypothetical protein E2K80_12885 [Rhodophyticola sp. CCM32]
MTDAKAIYQNLLDKVSEALLANDVEAFLIHSAIPHYIETETEKLLIATEQDVRDKFQIWSLTLRSKGVTDYARMCSEAAYVTPTRILGSHTSQFLHGPVVITPSFPSSLELGNHNGQWKVRRAIQQGAFVTWPDLLPRVSTNTGLHSSRQSTGGGRDVTA